MTILDTILIGILQGITEFLPISSSGHLELFQQFLGISPQNSLILTVVTHLGTLLAVLIYFRKTLLETLLGIFKKQKESLHLASALIIATLPVAIAGVFFNSFITSMFSTPLFILIAFIVSGGFFLLTEKIHAIHTTDASQKTPEQSITWKQTILIGLSQAVALFPGVSRSGTTLATGVLAGMKREKSAEFSFLLSIPTIMGAGILQAKDGFASEEVSFLLIAIGFLVSFLVGYFAIAKLMKFYQRYTLKPFAYYLFAIGGLGILYYSFFV